MKVLWNRLTGPKDLTDYQKFKHFSNALKDYSVYGYQLHTWINRSKIRWQLESTSYRRESFVEDLLRKSVPQSKVAVRLRLNVLRWCTWEACKYSISAIVLAAAMTSCSSAILVIGRFTSAFARKICEQMVALVQCWSLELHYQNF